MTSIIKKSTLTPAALTASTATYYTCPVNTRARILKVTVANVDTATRAFIGYLVPSGGSAGATNNVTPSQTIVVNEARDIFEMEGQSLEANGTVQGKVDAITTTAPNIYITVLETTV